MLDFLNDDEQTKRIARVLWFFTILLLIFILPLIFLGPHINYPPIACPHHH